MLNSSRDLSLAFANFNEYVNSMCSSPDNVMCNVPDYHYSSKQQSTDGIQVEITVDYAKHYSDAQIFNASGDRFFKIL